MLGDAECGCILLFLFRQYFRASTSTSTTAASTTTAATTAVLCSLNMVDRDGGELNEGDPEEAGGVGDARVAVASSSVVMLMAAIGDDQKPGSGVDISFNERIG